MRQILALRRVALGAHLTVLFESWDTVLFQIHEVLRVEGGHNSPRVAQEIAEYGRLGPGPQRLGATVFVDGGLGRLTTQVAATLATPGALYLAAGGAAFDGRCLDEDLEACAPVRYFAFELPASVARAIIEGRVELSLGLRLLADTVSTPLAAPLAEALGQDLLTASAPQPLLMAMAGA